MSKERRFVLLEVFPENENDIDDYDEALSELKMLEMLAERLGYQLIKSEPRQRRSH